MVGFFLMTTNWNVANFPAGVTFLPDPSLGFFPYYCSSGTTTFGGSACTVAFSRGHFSCKSNTDTDFCAKSSRDAFWCLTRQCRRAFRIEWVPSSTNRALKVFSTYCNPHLSVVVHRSWAFSVEAINSFLGFHTTASSLTMLSSMTYHFRRNWTMSEYDFNTPLW